MSISILNKNLQKIIASYVERPHILMQTSKELRTNVAELLFQGYEKEEALQRYVATVQEETDITRRALSITSAVLQIVSGHSDGRATHLPSSTFHPAYLAQIASYYTNDLVSFISLATKEINDPKFVSFSNNVLRNRQMQNPEKAAYIGQWVSEPNRGVLEKLTKIAVNKKLCFLPREIAHFSGVKSLILAGTWISFLPPCIGDLKSLEVLIVKNNKLVSLPIELNQLKNLTIFQAENNPFKSIPLALRQSENEAIRNELAKLPETAFAKPETPPTVQKSWWETICSWFEALLSWICSKIS